MPRLAFIAPFLLVGGCAGMSDAEFASATRTTVPGGFVPVGEVRLARTNAARGTIPEVFRRSYLRAEDIEMTRSISQIQFDNWFAEEGADLIAANVRDIPVVAGGVTQ